MARHAFPESCLLYTSDAADEEDSVDLGGRRIIKKKKKQEKAITKFSPHVFKCPTFKRSNDIR